MKINKLYGEAYNNAIYTVLDILNNTFNCEYFYSRDWQKAEEAALKLNIEFDNDGNIKK